MDSKGQGVRPTLDCFWHVMSNYERPKHFTLPRCEAGAGQGPALPLFGALGNQDRASETFWRLADAGSRASRRIRRRRRAGSLCV